MSNRSYVVFTQILQTYMVMAPVILVHGAGVVVCIIRWRRHPKVSRLALAGFGISLLLNIFMPVINGLITASMIERGVSAGAFGLSYPIMSIVIRSASAVFATVGYLMLVLAIFSDRPASGSGNSLLASDDAQGNRIGKA